MPARAPIRHQDKTPDHEFHHGPNEEQHRKTLPGEQPVVAYKTFRGSAVFTNKRLIVRDAQGTTGKKVEVCSLPYSAINMWSSENAGTFDMDAELELWTRAGHIRSR